MGHGSSSGIIIFPKIGSEHMSTGVSHVNELHLVFHDSHVRNYEEENWLINIR